MAVPHARSGQVIDVRPLGDQLRHAVTTTLVNSEQVEVIRLILPTGKQLPQHRVAGSITIQCLEGLVEVHAAESTQILDKGLMVYLAGDVLHSLTAVRDSAVLVTIHIPGNIVSAADVP